MNDIYEFFFCPVHGVFSPANWPVLIAVAGSIGIVGRRYWGFLVAFFNRKA